MTSKLVWQDREKTLANGTVVRWRERELASGLVERVFEDEFIRTTTAQHVSVRFGS